MTPRRWLLAASGVALLYAGQLLSAYLQGGAPTLPAQLDRIIIAIVMVGFILAGGGDLAGRAERRNRQFVADQNAAILAALKAELAEERAARAEDRAAIARLLTEGVDLLRRLGHVEVRTACKIDELADQIKRVGAVAARVEAALPGYDAGYADGLARQPMRSLRSVDMANT